MTLSELSIEATSPLEQPRESSSLHKLIHSSLPEFNRVLKKHLFFHLSFLFAIFAEISLFAAFFHPLSHSSVIALSLALIFLTLFSYFVLRFYYQTRKPEQIRDWVDRYAHSCQQAIHYERGTPEHHVALAYTYAKSASLLQGKEYLYYSPPRPFAMLAPTLEKLSCWLHWEDIHRVREALLQLSIKEQILLVACEPTNLEVHVALANGYVTLSSLYITLFDEEKWVPFSPLQDSFAQKFRETAEKAIEEFKILNDYAPNDPWIHRQLAYSYQDLQMPEEEIKEYETILQLDHNDWDTLYKLGKLYFQQGQNAKGLRVYEKLRQNHWKKAESLIRHYGSHAFD